MMWAWAIYFAACMTGPLDREAALISVGENARAKFDNDFDGDLDLRDFAYFQNRLTPRP